MFALLFSLLITAKLGRAQEAEVQRNGFSCDFLGSFCWMYLNYSERGVGVGGLFLPRDVPPYPELLLLWSNEAAETGDYYYSFFKFSIPPLLPPIPNAHAGFVYGHYWLPDDAKVQVGTHVGMSFGGFDFSLRCKGDQQVGGQAVTCGVSKKKEQFLEGRRALYVGPVVGLHFRRGRVSLDVDGVFHLTTSVFFTQYKWINDETGEVVTNITAYDRWGYIIPALNVQLVTLWPEREEP